MPPVTPPRTRALDRTVFAFDSKAYASSLAKLDAPLRPNARLRRTLRTTAPWEK